MAYSKGYFLELENGIVTRYLKDFNIGKLSKEEEYDLFIRFKNGDEVAKRKIFESNLWLISSFARVYDECGLTFDDLFQAGAIGLMTAIERFDVERGNRFTGYAVNWIECNIKELVADESRIISVPRWLFWVVSNYQEYCNKFLAEFGRVPTKDEVKEKFGLKESEFKCLEMALTDSLVFSQLLYEDFKSIELIRDDNDVLFADEKIYKDMLVPWSCEVLKMLSDENSEFIKYRFGLCGVPSETFRKLGERFGINFRTIHARVKRICKSLRQTSTACSQLDNECELDLDFVIDNDRTLENEFFEIIEHCNFTFEQALIAGMLFGSFGKVYDVNRVCKLECLEEYDEAEKLRIINDVIRKYVDAYKYFKFNKKK